VTLKWTREAPKVPGYFWVRPIDADADDRPVIHQVMDFEDGALYFDPVGLVSELTEWLSVFEFAGPIPPPEEDAK
jgi:hypothetical protein